MNYRPISSSVEILETRIAPAAVLPLTDIDGDSVVISTSKGTVADLTAAVKTIDVGLGKQIQRIDLTNPIFEGTTLTITAKRVSAGGNDFVNVGFVDATGIDLGVVKIDGDLGRIVAGDVDAKAGLGGLTVQSLGGYGISTQEAGGSVESVVKGPVGAFVVKSNVDKAYFRAETDGLAIGSIASLTIGSSLIGGAASDSGRIEAAGNIGAVKINGSILAGAGARSGSIDSGGKITSVTVKGSLVGGLTVQDSGVIESDLGMGAVNIGGNIQGGLFQNTGAINTPGPIASVSVGGSLLGSDGVESGQIEAGSIGPVKILGSVRGGVGDDSGQIKSGGNLGVGKAVAGVPAPAGVKISGALEGGSGLRSGSIIAGTSTSEVLGPVSIGLDLEGGSADHAGSISSAGSIGSVTIGGSVRGGTADNTGLIEAGVGSGTRVATLGLVTIKGSLIGSSLDLAAADDLENTGYITGPKMTGVSVKNDIVAGEDLSVAFDLINNASIRASKNIGTLVVGGSILGNAETRVLITAETAVVPTNFTSNVTIGSVSVAGSVFYTDILVGYQRDSQDLISTTSAAAVNFDAQMRSLKVNGDWMASNLAVGAKAGPDGVIGTMDDQRTLPGGPGLPVNASLGSATIGGQVLATASTIDRYGIIAEMILSMKIGGAKIGLTPLGRNDIESTGEQTRFYLSDDTRFHEVPVA